MTCQNPTCPHHVLAAKVNIFFACDLKENTSLLSTFTFSVNVKNECISTTIYLRIIITGIGSSLFHLVVCTECFCEMIILDWFFSVGFSAEFIGSFARG